MRTRRRRREGGGDTLDGRPTGSVLRVIGIDGGASRTMRLLALGIQAGREIVVTGTRGGAVIVASDAGRIALGAEMARHVHVEEVGRC